MTRRYVEIRYTDAVERVPLPDLGELPQILADRGSYVSYSIHSSWRYGLVPHGKGRTVYESQVSPQTDLQH
jgi:hypothetical protein